jgi:hypothetical protein
MIAQGKRSAALGFGYIKFIKPCKGAPTYLTVTFPTTSSLARPYRASNGGDRGR